MLSLTSLQAGYGSQTIVAAPDLVLAQGDKCLIRGASGSGKTTLLQAIAGLNKPLAGKITLDGVDLYELSESACDKLRGQKIGIVFQSLHLIKSLTVMQNILLAAHMAGKPQNESAARALLYRLGLSGFEDRPADHLSQGQAQRVAIARALINQPAVILADEPTSSLDDKACVDTIALLMELADEARAILIVSSHDTRLPDTFTHTIQLEG